MKLVHCFPGIHILPQSSWKSIRKIKKVVPYMVSMICSTVRAPGRSFLLPRTNTGISASCGLSSKLRSSVLAASSLSWSAASITNLLFQKWTLANKMSRFFPFFFKSKLKERREKKQILGHSKSRSSSKGATYTMALTPLQYLSHMLLNRGWPPMSQSFIVTLPLVTLRMLKPTVGIMSSENCPDYEWHEYFFKEKG